MPCFGRSRNSLVSNAHGNLITLPWRHQYTREKGETTGTLEPPSFIRYLPKALLPQLFLRHTVAAALEDTSNYRPFSIL